jgi:hypothetical protein
MIARISAGFAPQKPIGIQQAFRPFSRRIDNHFSSANGAAKQAFCSR